MCLCSSTECFCGITINTSRGCSITCRGGWSRLLVGNASFAYRNNAECKELLQPASATSEIVLILSVCRNICLCVQVSITYITTEGQIWLPECMVKWNNIIVKFKSQSHRSKIMIPGSKIFCRCYFGLTSKMDGAAACRFNKSEFWLADRLSVMLLTWPDCGIHWIQTDPWWIYGPV